MQDIFLYDLQLQENNRHPMLIKETAIAVEPSELNLRFPDHIASFMFKHFSMADLAEEHLYLLTMNTKCKPLGLFLIGKGTADQCLVDPRTILIRALLSGATQFILIHNHPSGDPTPSNEDVQSTKRVFASAKLINIQLTDHIILGDYKYHSMCEKGEMDPL